VSREGEEKVLDGGSAGSGEEERGGRRGGGAASKREALGAQERAQEGFKEAGRYIDSLEAEKAAWRRYALSGKTAKERANDFNRRGPGPGSEACSEGRAGRGCASLLACCYLASLLARVGSPGRIFLPAIGVIY
jgi:hypothetical protein